MQTELCRNWEKSGSCPYGVKCQFAHGLEELRPAGDHPRFRTEVCRSFAVNGTCRFGARCRFMHVAPGSGLELEPEQLPPPGEIMAELMMRGMGPQQAFVEAAMMYGADMSQLQQVGGARMPRSRLWDG